MNILLVGGDVKAQAENLNALQLAFGEETGLKLVSSFGDVRRELQSGQYHVVLDLGLPIETRWRLLRLARQLDPLVQVIMLFAGDEKDRAADALRQGASKVLVRGHTYPALLSLIVERAYEHYLEMPKASQAPDE